MRKTILVAVMLLATPVAAGAQPSFTAEGEELLRKLTAQQFDSRLPDAGLKPWLTGLLGKLAQIDWSTADCGDEGGGPDPSASQGNAPQGNAPLGNADQGDAASDNAGSDLDSPCAPRPWPSSTGATASLLSIAMSWCSFWWGRTAPA